MSKETLWMRQLTERAEGDHPNGAHACAVVEYRKWGDVAKRHDEAGCPNPACRMPLFDRLTHIFYYGPKGVSFEWHLDSGPDLNTLRNVRVAEWGGRDEFVRGRKLSY